MADKDNSSNELESPDDIFDDIDSTLDELHEDLAESATLIGQERERFSGLRPTWQRLSQESTNDLEVANIYLSGLRSLSAFRDELGEVAQESQPAIGRIRAVISSTDSAATITSSSSMAFIPGILVPDDLTLPRFDRSSGTIQALNNIDPSLANTYKAIREVLYGTRSDPERGALYLIRQMYDHFFGKLAPDEKVRQSSCWVKKDGDKPYLITRRERADYVAHTHVSNPTKIKRLIASTDHMLDVYHLLNKAHARKSLDADQAREALREMHILIEEWLLSFDQ